MDRRVTVALFVFPASTPLCREGASSLQARRRQSYVLIVYVYCAPAMKLVEWAMCGDVGAG